MSAEKGTGGGWHSNGIESDYSINQIDVWAIVLSFGSISEKGNG